MGWVDDLLFGQGKQIVAITGEGGVGKTRLVAEWQKQVETMIETEHPVAWLSGYGRSYGQRTHGLFIDILEQLCGINAQDPPTECWNKLARRLRESLADSGPDWVNLSGLFSSRKYCN